MRFFSRILILMLLAGVLWGAGRPAEAQILKRIKDRATERVREKAEKKGEEAANEATDAAVDRATEGAERRVDEAIREGTQDIGNPSGVAVPGAVTGSGGGDGPVDFRELRALLPESLPGLKRTDARGERGGMFGIRTSQAEGEYSDESGEKNLQITITDLGTMRSAAMLGYAWLNTEVDQESDDGYERTIKFKGFPGYEELSRSEDYQNAKMQVVVAQRFVVAIETSSFDMDFVRAAFDRIDLAKLESLNTTGAGAGSAAGEPMDHAALKALLPASVQGFNRTSASGEKTSAMGMKMSTAKGEYGQTGGNGSITVTITDMGNMSGVTMLGYAWMTSEIDNENDRGYERSIKYKGFPGLEKFSKDSDTASTGQIMLVINQRFTVTVDGHNVPMEALKAALDPIDLTKLTP